MYVCKSEAVYQFRMPSSQVSPVVTPDKNGVYDNGARGASALRKEKEWIPYELAFTETPILFPLAFPLRYWVRLRDTIFRNAFLDWRIPVPCWKRADRLFTWIEMLILILCSAVVVVFYVIYWTKTPNKDDVEDSGLSRLLFSYKLESSNRHFDMYFVISLFRYMQVGWQYCQRRSHLYWRLEIR